MSNRFLWLLLTGLALCGLLILARGDNNPIFGLTNNDLADLVVKIAFLIFLGSAVLVMFRENLGQALRAVVMWVVIALALALGYTYRFEMRDIYERTLAEFVPGRAFSKGQTVEIARGRSGDFSVGVTINGARVPMALDTGASAVVLTQEAAKAAGLPLELLNYDVSVDTANGRTRAASVTLDRVGVGAIAERSVPALIAQPGQLRTSLLGMSFLNRLQGWEVRGDKLILRGHP